MDDQSKLTLFSTFNNSILICHEKEKKTLEQQTYNWMCRYSNVNHTQSFFTDNAASRPPFTSKKQKFTNPPRQLPSPEFSVKPDKTANRNMFLTNY